MLNSKYQMFLLMLKVRPLTRNEVGIFRTRKSFYKMTGYLTRNKLIMFEVLDNGRKKFELTTRGDIIASMLLTLDDVNEKMAVKYIRNGDLRIGGYL